MEEWGGGLGGGRGWFEVQGEEGGGVRFRGRKGVDGGVRCRGRKSGFFLIFLTHERN